jgi:hydroxyacylglutathione hydrolase
MQFYCYFSVKGFSNAYIIGPDEGGDAILIDPGSFDVPLLDIIEQNGLYVKYVLLTHSHDSHILGIKTLVKIYDVKIYSGSHLILDQRAEKIREGDKLKLGDFTCEVMETPGHSGDSVVFKINNLLFTGDTLFAGSIGSTPDNYARELIVSIIHEKILCLDDEYFIFPGHGPPSKVGIERILNPYL